ncbi:HtaA domain-containing protein [Agrococcus jejuensis]|uniref:Htaa protein n=1 Tax=Agrococcus jejuensis TaxID=399736 RepID=A0A1G8B6K9_9MICO|nr:HtaA domain-containing protein [Agrococcus jejuensis]SDH28869.1 Htaa protein [Agrococcus jejuensis]
MHSAMPVRRRALATILSALLVAAGAVGVVAAPPASAATQDVANATLDWGVKQSFRSYIAGPIANGTTIVSGGVVAGANGFTWASGAGSADAATSAGTVSLPGSVQFQGHGGLLDLTLSDARVELVSATEGYLVFDVASKGLQSGTIEQHPDTRFAQIDLTGLATSAESISIAGAASTLTEAGAAAFAGFYSAGTALDPVTFTLPLVAVEQPTDPGTEPTDPGTDPTDPGTDPTDPGTDPTDPGTDPTDPGTDPVVPVTPAEPTHDVAGATIDWTFRASWLRYQAAAGQISAADGVEYRGTTDGFRWAGNGTGVVDADAASALVAFPGTFGFFAHGGMIDIDLTNLRIELVSATEAYLVLDATSSTNGDQPNLRFATIDLSSAVFGDESVTVTNAAIAITAEAAPIFTYQPGDEFGTATFTLPLAAVEAPVDPTEPGTDPTGPGTDPTDPGTTDPETGLGIADATLQWGIRSSFRSYVVGPIANGTITPSGGVTMDASGFSWTGGTGVADEATGTALVAYPGHIRFTGHGGQLDLTISDVRLRIDSATQATIVASTVSRSLGSTEYVTQTGIDFATVTLAAPAARAAGDVATAAVAEGTLTIANAPAVLTEDGAAGFAGFYAAGSELDPVSATLPIASTTQPQEPGTPEQPQQPTPIQPPVVVPTNPVQQQPVQQAAEQQEQCTANAVSGATMTWGIRSSFRSYISGGIANGGWTTTGGVSDVDGGWQWSGGSGAIQLDGTTGLVSLPGSIHFAGHSGALDLTVSDVRIRLTGPSSGTIVADVVSKGMEDGQLHTYSDIAFASLSFSSTVSGGALTVSGATATLTAAGAEGFAGFYGAGEALDPVSFTLPIGAEVECSVASGTLPQTGAEQRIDVLLPMVALAALLMAGGLVLRRRLARA